MDLYEEIKQGMEVYKKNSVKSLEFCYKGNNKYR